jgi:hypothetical protein
MTMRVDPLQPMHPRLLMSLAPWLRGVVAESTKASKVWTIFQFARERRLPTNFTMQYNIELCPYRKQMA